MAGNYDAWIQRNAAKKLEDKQLWDSRLAFEKEKVTSGLTDESGPLGEGVASTDWLGRSNLTQNEGVTGLPGSEMANTDISTGDSVGKSGGGGAGAAGAAMAKELIGGGSALDIGAMGAMAAGGPIGIGAGLGLAALSANQKRKNAQKQAEYDAKVDQFNARRQAINKLADIGASLKA